MVRRSTFENNLFPRDISTDETVDMLNETKISSCSCARSTNAGVDDLVNSSNNAVLRLRDKNEYIVEVCLSLFGERKQQSRVETNQYAV